MFGRAFLARRTTDLAQRQCPRKLISAPMRMRICIWAEQVHCGARGDGFADRRATHGGRMDDAARREANSQALRPPEPEPVGSGDVGARRELDARVESRENEKVPPLSRSLSLLSPRHFLHAASMGQTGSRLAVGLPAHRLARHWLCFRAVPCANGEFRPGHTRVRGLHEWCLVRDNCDHGVTPFSRGLRDCISALTTRVLYISFLYISF
jgi:hypothetical protein